MRLSIKIEELQKEPSSLQKQIDALRENISGHYNSHNIPIEELRREIEKIKKTASTG